MNFEEDWSDLRLRKPVVPTGELLDDLVEDWDVLQGRNSWFVGLYDPQLKLIPGTIRRVDEAKLQEDLVWLRIPCKGTVAFTGYWSKSQQKQFAKFPEAIELEAGQSFGVKLQFTWTFTPITLSLDSLNSIAGNTFSSSTMGAATNTSTFTFPTDFGINNTITFT